MNALRLAPLALLLALPACGSGNGHTDADGDVPADVVEEDAGDVDSAGDARDQSESIDVVEEDAGDVEELVEADAETPDDGGPIVCPDPPGVYGAVGTWSDVSHDLVYAAGRVFVADNAADRVVVFDVVTNEQVGEVSAGPWPYHLAAGDDLVYTLNMYAGTAPDEIVTVIDPWSMSRIAGVPIPVVGGEEANYPGDIGFYDGVAYVSNFTFSTPSVFPIDPATWRCRTGWPAGSGPGGIAGSDGSLFVVNGRAIFDDTDDAVLVYTPGGSLLTTLETGGAIKDIITGGDGRVFVSRSSTTAGESRLLAIDPTTYAITEIVVGDQPNGLAVWENLIFTANKGGPSVSVVDTAAGDTVREIDLRTVDPPLVNLRGIVAAPCGKLYLEADGLIAVYPGAY
jgi:hypothetical protein